MISEKYYILNLTHSLLIGRLMSIRGDSLLGEVRKRRRRGERPDGYIQVSVVVGRKPNGSYIRKYFYGKTRAEAEKKRIKYQMRQSGASSEFSNDITVAQWVEKFKATYRNKVNEAYIACDDVPYNRLVNRLGTMRVVDVREHHLQDALGEVRGMSYSTVDKYMHAIKRVFYRAKKNKIIADDPSEDLEMPTYTEGTHRALESWEIKLILENWDNPVARSGLWVLIMMLCGLRRGEMMALEWNAVDLDRRILRVQQVAVVHKNKTVIEQRAKTDAGLRILPMPRILCDALSKVPVQDRVGFVCLSARGNPLSDSSSKRGIEQFCRIMERLINGEPIDQRGRRTDREDTKKDQQLEAADRIPFSFTAHDLRHTYATALYDAHVDVKSAQYFLGHSDIKITLDLYTHLSREREVESRNQAVKFLDSWLDNSIVKNVIQLDSGDVEIH